MTTPQTSGLLEAALYTDDLTAAEQFYGDALGLPVVMKMEGRHVFFRVGQTILLVFDPEATENPGDGKIAAPPHDARGPGHACIGSDDLAAWEAHLDAAGVEIERRLTWPNGARSIYFRDPAGNSLEIAEPKLWNS